MTSVDDVSAREIGVTEDHDGDGPVNSKANGVQLGQLQEGFAPSTGSRSHASNLNEVDIRTDSMDPYAAARRIRLGWCLVDLMSKHLAHRLFEGHLGRPPGTGSLLVASANLDHIARFARAPDGDGLDPGRMSDWLVLLDGMPLVRAASRATGLDYPRLTGADLLPELFTIAESHSHSVAILGGRPELRQPLAKAMELRWPQLRVATHLTPSRAELTDGASSHQIQARLADLAPDLLVVCLGKPLQERWMARNARGTGAKVVVGFGAAIDFIAGTTPRAPKWMQESGLEWSYRLMREPRRMAHRYLIEGPAALAKLRSDAGTGLHAGAAVPPAQASPRERQAKTLTRQDRSAGPLDETPS